MIILHVQPQNHDSVQRLRDSSHVVWKFSLSLHVWHWDGFQEFCNNCCTSCSSHPWRLHSFFKMLKSPAVKNTSLSLDRVNMCFFSLSFFFVLLLSRLCLIDSLQEIRCHPDPELLNQVFFWAGWKRPFCVQRNTDRFSVKVRVQRD